MAKSGPVTAPVRTSAAIADAVVAVEAPSMTLGQIVANAFGGSNTPEVVAIDLADRKVHVFDQASSADVPVGDAQATFTPDADGKVAPWTGVGDAQMTPIANLAAKPQRSIAALINALEDHLLTRVDLVNPVIVVDQVAETVSVMSRDAAEGLLDNAKLASFQQTVEASTTTIKNAFE